MTKTLWLLACFGIFYACSCHKTPVEPAFQNSFSCRINGVDWKPEGGTNATGGIKNPTIIVGKFYFDAIDIDALKNIRDSKTGDDIVFEGIKFIVFLDTNKPQILKGSTFYKYGPTNNGCSRFYSDSISTNMVKVLTLDTSKRIVKGIFEFEATSPTCNQTVKITNGNFEVKY